MMKDLYYLVLLDDGSFWTQGERPEEGSNYLEFQRFEDAFRAGMAHRSKYDKPKRKGNS